MFLTMSLQQSLQQELFQNHGRMRCVPVESIPYLRILSPVYAFLQLQMIETRVFDDINKLTPIEGMTIDGPSDMATTPTERPRGGWLQKLFKTKRQVSES